MGVNGDSWSMKRVEAWLSDFESQADSGSFQTPWCAHYPGASAHGPHIVFGVLTHGNEFGPLPAALRLQQALATGSVRGPGPVTLLLGNPEAARRNVRFVDEDLNRVMTFDAPAESLERRRALELKEVLDSADVFLDIHQTQTPTASAFWTLPWSGELGLWARAIGAAPVGLTRKGGAMFSVGKCCLDEYVRARGRLGITVEVGTRGEDPSQAELAYQAMVRVLEIQSALSMKRRTLASLAAENPPVRWYETREIVPGKTPAHRLRPGLGNWVPARKGELLSAPESPEIRASEDGFVLFPKYPADPSEVPSELFRLGTEVSDPESVYGDPV